MTRWEPWRGSAWVYSWRCLVCGILTACGGVGVRAASPLPVSQSWTSPDAARGDELGRSVAVWGDWALIGAPQHDAVGIDTGAAYLLDLTTQTTRWKFVPPDGRPGDGFGYSVALSGNLAVVGAQFADPLGNASGAVYGFDVASGEMLWKATSPLPHAGGEFGVALDLDGNDLVVGAHKEGPGAAYLFEARTGRAVRGFFAEDRAPDDLFGVAVAVDQGRVLVGARYDDDQAIASGSAYLFDVSTGQQLHKMIPHDGARGDRFGMYLDLAGQRAVVASRYDDDAVKSSGSAYIYDTQTGAELYKIVAADATPNDQFGSDVWAFGDQVLIGAVDDDHRGIYAGSAYLFNTQTGTQVAKFEAADARTFDRLGMSVAMNDRWIVLGASMVDYLGVTYDAPGKVYIYQVPEPTGMSWVLGGWGAVALFRGRRRSRRSTASAVDVAEFPRNG